MKIFFSVGEPSGDLHGANLVRSLQKQYPGLRCVGYGGPRMEAEGCELHEDLTRYALMGFLPVIGKLPMFYRLMKRAEKYFQDHPPDAVVLIDYPGFNWWIARKAKQCGIPVFYYGVPQIWAWARWRVSKIRRFVDHALCKLPFEKEWYGERGCQATYVGHPYFDELSERRLDQGFLDQQAALPGRLVTILPGSRRREVTRQLPTFLKAARQIKGQLADVRFAIASFNSEQAEMAREFVEHAGVEAEIHVGKTGELIEACHCAMACSGSVSLELMYHEKPAAILYKVNIMQRLINRLLVRVRYMTLVNLLASTKRFDWLVRDYDPERLEGAEVPLPEYPTSGDRSGAITAHVVRWLEDESRHRQTVDWLHALSEKYAIPGATQRAAEYIIEMLDQDSSGARPEAA
ncbi:MAG: lipid-A-disaccharide synthase [Planctomycetota bacterium]|nr:lipid-A-disaccharide synthase [Planctomycetota bacterium]